jgi:hypothetical protein
MYTTREGNGCMGGVGVRTMHIAYGKSVVLYTDRSIDLNMKHFFTHEIICCLVTNPIMPLPRFDAPCLALRRTIQLCSLTVSTSSSRLSTTRSQNTHWQSSFRFCLSSSNHPPL